GHRHGIDVRLHGQREFVHRAKPPTSRLTMPAYLAALPGSLTRLPIGDTPRVKRPTHMIAKPLIRSREGRRAAPKPCSRHGTEKHENTLSRRGPHPILGHRAALWRGARALFECQP